VMVCCSSKEDDSAEDSITLGKPKEEELTITSNENREERQAPVTTGESHLQGRCHWLGHYWALLSPVFFLLRPKLSVFCSNLYLDRIDKSINVRNNKMPNICRTFL